jgi:hypothetical protein
MELESFIIELNKLPCSYRLHTLAPQKPNNWSGWIVCPVPSVVETGYDGPISFEQVVAIEVDPIEKKWIGKRVPEQEVDHCKEVIDLLTRLEIPYDKADGKFCIEMKKVNPQ